MSSILLAQSSFHAKSYPRHAHDGYSISLVLEGVHFFAIEGERMEAKAGDIRIIHPYEEHETIESTWKHINLSLERSSIESIAASMQIAPPVMFSRLINDSLLSERVQQLHKAYTKEVSKHIEELSHTLILYLLQKHRFDSAMLPTPTPTQIDQAISYIQSHAHEADLNLDEVAKKAQMSKYHFLRVFKQTLGRTPHQYLQNIRVDCVRKEIANGRSFAEAAYHCGFYDQSHMIKIYKKFYGHTPREILRKKEQ